MEINLRRVTSGKWTPKGRGVSPHSRETSMKPPRRDNLQVGRKSGRTVSPEKQIGLERKLSKKWMNFARLQEEKHDQAT